MQEDNHQIQATLIKAYNEYPDKKNVAGFITFVQKQNPLVSRKKINDFLRKQPKN
tara:strand:- start:354 stop:518 length:165 start_codon:yes stop_codon:yes gene_type:complete